MKVTFYIEYFTRWGEELYLMLNDDKHSALKMSYTPGGVWTVTMPLSDDTRQLCYRYMVKCGGEVVREEQCRCHTLHLAPGVQAFQVQDSWDDTASIAGTDGLMGRLVQERDSRISLDAITPGSLVIQAVAPMRDRTMRLAVAGASPALGEWDVKRAVPMQPCGNAQWRAIIQLPHHEAPTQFKLIMVPLRGRAGEVRWEQGDNRWLRHAPHPDEVSIIGGLHFNGDGLAWKQVGTLVQLKTLKGDHDAGVGDMGDLKKVVQWAHASRQDAVACVSLGDESIVAGWMPDDLRQLVIDNAIDPAYLRLAALGTLVDKKRKAQFQRAALEMNAGNKASLQQVRQFKLDYASELFEIQATSTSRSRGYRDFVATQARWLKPYVAQCLLARINDTTDVTRWGRYARYDAAMVDRFLRARHREAALCYYVQYHLWQQLLQVFDYAQDKQVNLLCCKPSTHVQLMMSHEPWVCERQIGDRLRNAPAGLTLIPLRDWLLTDGNYNGRLAAITDHDQRLPITVQELVAATDFNRRLSDLIARSIG